MLDVNGGSTADGATIIQWPWTGATNQQWRLLPNRDGSFRLSCSRSGKVLDSPGGSGQGAALIQWADNGGTNQWWTLVPTATSGNYRLVNVGNGWCVDIEGGSTADGARTVQRRVQPGMANHPGMRSTVDPYLYPISVPRSRVSVLNVGEGIPPPGLGGQFAVSTYMIECAVIADVYVVSETLSHYATPGNGR